MTLVQDIFAKFYNFFFTFEQRPPATNHGNRNLYRKGFANWGISTFWWYLGMVVVSFSPVLITIYKIYIARRSSKKRAAKHPHSQLQATQTNLVSAVKNRLGTGTYRELNAKHLKELGHLGQGDDSQENPDSYYHDQLNWSSKVSKVHCTEGSSRLGPRLVKLFIKKPPSLSDAFQDHKKKFVFSLMSPAKQAKKRRRMAKYRNETKAPEKESSSSQEQIYSTARNIVDDDDDLPASVRRSQSFQPNCSDPGESIGKKTKSIGHQLFLDQDLPKRGNNKLSISKSPTKKKKRKKKQHKRSIFSKSMETKKAREPDHPISEADSSMLTLKSIETQDQIPPCQMQLVPGNDKSRRRVAVSKQDTNNRVFQGPISFYTEGATQELQSLIRQVESENRARKSVSPRPSKTFAEIQGTNQTLCSKKSGKKKKGRLPLDMSMDRHPNESVILAERNRRNLPVSIAKSLQPVTAVEKAPHKTCSGGQYSKSEDTSCCLKGVSLSCLNKIASMSGQDKSSVVTGRQQSLKQAKLRNRSSYFAKQSFHNDYHRAFVKAPRCYNLKPVSPDVTPQPKSTQFRGGQHDKHKTKGTKCKVKAGDQLSAVAKQPLLRKPSAKNKRASDLLKKVETHFIRNADYPRRTFHTRPVSLLTRERSTLAHPHHRPVAANRQNSRSASPSSHFSFLGCIGPSESTMARNAIDKPLPLRKNLENERSMGKKSNNKAQPIEGYILNSKTPIANTLLLCRSGITRTYENWTSEETHGPGKVKAISKTSCTNRFPSLSSYLDYLERKAKLQNNSQSKEVEHSERQSTGWKNLTKQENSAPGNRVVDEIGFPKSKEVIEEQSFKEREQIITGVIKHSAANNGTKIQSPPAATAAGDTDLANNKKRPCTIKNPPTVSSVVKHSPHDKHTQTKDSKAQKQIFPVKKNDIKSYPFRPKLRFKYLPLTKQPLPFSSPAKNKKKSLNEGDPAEQESRAAPNTLVSEMENIARPNQNLLEHKKITLAEPESKIAPAAICELKKEVKKDSDCTREANSDKPLCIENTKPVVVNLRTFCKRSCSRTNHVKGKSYGHTQKPPETKTPTVASAEETSPSVDLQSLLEMAKSVLKKSNTHMSKAKNDKRAHNATQEHNVDHIKSEDQTPESCRWKWSHVTKKEPNEVRPDTAGDQSYTHLYKTKEPRGLKPWRTTKAFTTRLKLMLQNSKEHCMKRKSEQLSEPKRERKQRKAYVVHKAILPNFPLYLDRPAESGVTGSASKKTSSFGNNNMLQRKIVKGDDPVKIVKGKTPVKKSKAPTLRTEALAKKRSKSMDKKQQEDMNILTKKKKGKSKGTPLHLTDTQLYQDTVDNALDCDLMVHSTKPHSEVVPVNCTGAPINEAILRRLPYIGMDPAKVARLKEKAFNKTRSSACSTAQSRENQVQNELCGLLEKMKTRNTGDGFHLSSGLTGEGVKPLTRKETTEEKLSEEDCSQIAADLTEHIHSGDACIRSVSREHVVLSDLSGNHTQSQDERVTDNTVLQPGLDHEPPTAALKFLLQCACSKFHSMPNLPDIKSCIESEGISKEWEASIEETIPIKMHSIVSTTEYAPINHSTYKGQDNAFPSPPCKNESRNKPESTLSKAIFSNTNEAIVLEKRVMDKPTINSVNKKKRLAWKQNSLTKVLKGHEKKHLASHVPSSTEGISQRTVGIEEIDTSMKLCVQKSLQDNTVPNFEDTVQSKKTRIDITIMGLPVEEKSVDAPKIENNFLHKKSSLCDIDCEKSNNKSCESKYPEETLKQTKYANSKYLGDKTLVSLPSFKDLLIDGETYESVSLSGPMTTLTDDSRQSPRSVLKQLSSDIEAYIGEDFHEEDAFVGDHSPQLKTRYEKQQKLEHGNRLLCPALVTCSPSRGCSEHEETVVPGNLFDAEYSFSERHGNASQVTTFDREATVTSGYRTVEISSSSMFSPKSNRGLHGFVSPPSTFVEQPFRRFNLGSKSGPHDAGCKQFPSQNITSLNAKDISVRKALSHISEESYSSEAYLNNGTLESCRKKHTSNENEAEISIEEDALSAQTLAGIQQEIGFPKDNSLRNQIVHGRPAHFSDLDRVRQGSHKAVNSLPMVETLGPVFKTLSELEILSRAESLIQEQESPGLWITSIPSLSREIGVKEESKTKHQRDGIKASNMSLHVVGKDTTKVKSDVGVTDRRNRLQDIPVTVIYTNQNSDIPDLSFTNEDEFSLDSLAQNSVSFGKKSLEAGSNSDVICHDENKYSEQDFNGTGNASRTVGCAKKLPLSFSKHCKLSFDTDENTRHKESVSPNENNKISENNKSNSNDFTNEKKDLESLLDSALDKTSISKKSEGASLVFTKSGQRKARSRRNGIRRLGCNREVVRGANTDSSNFRKTFSKNIATTKNSDLPPNFKNRLVTLKASIEQKLSGNITMDSLDSIKFNVKNIISSEQVGFETVRNTGSNEEQILKNILKKVPPQPFGIMRCKKLSGNDLRLSDHGESKRQMQVSSSEGLQASFETKENGGFLNRTDVGIDDTDGHDISLPLGSVATYDCEKNASEGARKQANQEQVKQIYLVPTMPNTEDHNVMKVDNQENVEFTAAHDALHQECTNPAMQKPVNCFDKIEEDEDDETFKENTNMKAVIRCSNESINTVQNLRDAVNVSLSNFLLATNAIDESTQRPVKQLSDQKIFLGREGSHRESPSTSKSSSIILSWVGSHQNSDVDADVIPRLAAQCPMSVATLDHSGVDAGFSHGTDGEGESHIGTTPDLLLAQSFSSRLDHLFLSSELVSNAGPLKQNNLNENNTKAGMEIYSLTSEVIESSTAISYDDNGSNDEYVELDTLSDSRNDLTRGKNNYLALTGKNKNGETILDQESYLQNLMHSMKWDIESPPGEWEVIRAQKSPCAPFGPHTQSNARQLLPTGQVSSERDSRCGYVISAWTNQRQHSDLGLGVSLSTASNQNLSSGKRTACTRAPLSKSPRLEKKFSNSRRVENMSSLDTPLSKLRENRSQGTDCGRKTIRSRELCPTKNANGNIQSFDKSSTSNLKVTDDFDVSSSMGPGCWKSNGSVEKTKHARTLEEHLRLYSCTPGIQAANSVTLRDPYQALYNGHLSTRSDGVRSRDGDRSPHCQYSLNWYRPQSLSSSNSLNASHATEPGRLPAESRLSDRGTHHDSSRNDVVRARARSETGDITVSNQQAAPSASVVNRLEGQEQTVNTALRGQQRDNKKVSTIVQMFEMKNSSTKQSRTN